MMAGTEAQSWRAVAIGRATALGTVREHAVFLTTADQNAATVHFE